MKRTTKRANPEKPAVDKKKTVTARAAKTKTAVARKTGTAKKTDTARKVAAKAEPSEVAEDPSAAAKAEPSTAAKSEPSESIETPSAAAKAEPSAAAEGERTIPPQSQPKPEKRKSGGVSLFLWILGIAITIGAGAATWPFWSAYIVPHTAVSKDARDQINIAERLSNIEKNIADNAKTGNILQDLLDEKKNVKDRLDKLMVDINSLDAALKSVRQMVEATTPPSSQAANANESLQKLSDRFAKIEKSSETLGSLLQRMDALEKKTQVAQDQPTIIDKNLSDAIDAISQRVGALESANIGQEPHGGTALMLAVSQLREKLHGSGPFSTQLAALVELAGDGSEIAGSLSKIKPYAYSGIPSLNSLRAEFPDVSISLSELSSAASGNGWLDRVRKRVSSLISLRRIDGKMDAVITKTQNLLNDGDLAGAVDAMAVYSDASPKVAKWVSSARKRLAAESAIAALHVFALSLVTPRKDQSR